MSAIQVLTNFSSPNLMWTTYQMGYDKRTSSIISSSSYAGNIIVPVNMVIPTKFEVYFKRTVPDHTGVLGYYVNNNLSVNAIWSSVGEYKLRTIDVNSWSGISSIQFRSTIEDYNFDSSPQSEWKVYANGVLIYYHAFDRRPTI